jgi:hypothetical protein
MLVHYGRLRRVIVVAFDLFCRAISKIDEAAFNQPMVFFTSLGVPADPPGLSPGVLKIANHSHSYYYLVEPDTGRIRYMG